MKRSLPIVLFSCVVLTASTSRAGDLSYQILTLEHQRNTTSPLFERLSASPDTETAVRVALAMGRIGDASFIPILKRQIEDERPEVRQAAAFALGLIQTTDSAVILATLLESEEHSLVRSTAVQAYASTRHGEAEFLLRHEPQDPSESTATAQAIGVQYTYGSSDYQPSVEELLPLVSLLGSSQGAEKAAFALSRLKQKFHPVLPEVVSSLTAIRAPEARALLLRALSFHDTDEVRKLLQQYTRSPHLGTATEAIRGLSRQAPHRETASTLSAALRASVPSLNVEGLQAIGALQLRSVMGEVYRLARSHPSPWVRSEAILAGSALKDARIAAVAGRALRSMSALLQRSALIALARLAEGPEDLGAISRAMSSNRLLLKIWSAEALTEVDFEIDLAGFKSMAINLLDIGDLALSTYVAQLIQQRAWGELADQLINGYKKFSSPDDIEAKIAILDALASFQRKEDVGFFETVLNDPVAQVSQHAAAILTRLTGEDRTSDARLHTASSQALPTPDEVEQAEGRKVRIFTSKGAIDLLTLAEAPLTASNFLALVQQGFYDNQTFHRVVPNFVIQGGDPRGDGFGGPGYMIREEISPLSHSRGMVGMATAGKDTAGSQIFINHAPNLHLDGNYTIFARVIRGMGVVDRITPEDRISRVAVMNH